MEFEKEGQGSYPAPEDWRRDAPEEPDAAPNHAAFDFDAFLEDDLEARITSILGGKDLMEPDAFGQSVPAYTPRPAPDGVVHGKHEAPSPVSTAQHLPADTPWQEETPPEEELSRATPARESVPEEEPAAEEGTGEPRFTAPERPRVVVARPRPSVVVTPPGAENYTDYDYGYDRRPPSPPRRNGGLKWTAVILAIIAAFGLFFIVRLYRGGGDEAGATPGPAVTPSAAQAVPAAVTPTPVTQVTSAPASKTRYITVTAGTGGSVSPSGAVGVEEGKDITFTITPKQGYELTQLLIDGKAAELSDSYRFANVTADHTLYAVFSPAVTPTPAATPTPPPSPEPTAEPTPDPTPEPTAEPTPEPTLEPTPTPAPEPEAEPAPEPAGEEPDTGETAD